jgi:hypothetical protein
MDFWKVPPLPGSHSAFWLSYQPNVHFGKQEMKEEKKIALRGIFQQKLNLIFFNKNLHEWFQVEWLHFLKIQDSYPNNNNCKIL